MNSAIPCARTVITRGDRARAGKTKTGARLCAAARRPLNESVKRLEEKIAYLERHVVEQDKAMLELADDLARLRKELLKLRTVRRNRLRVKFSRGGDERPPHY